MFLEQSVFPQKNTGLHCQQCLSFLMARKCVGENVVLPEHKHVNIIDRGGLLEVNEYLYIYCYIYFQNCRALF